MKRKLSLLFGAFALFVLPLWGYFQASGDAAAQRDIHGFVCGMPILAIYFLALVGSGILSVVALCLGVLAYRSLPSPRPKARILELLVLALPLVVATIVVVWFSVAFAGA